MDWKDLQRGKIKSIMKGSREVKKEVSIQVSTSRDYQRQVVHPMKLFPGYQFEYARLIVVAARIISGSSSQLQSVP